MAYSSEYCTGLSMKFVDWFNGKRRLVVQRMTTEQGGAQHLLHLGADLLAAHVLFLVILRLAAGHILLFLLLGRGWFAGERHRRTDAKREEGCECDEACVASHGILLVMNELMKPSHCNMRCCDSRKHSVRLTSGEALCHGIEQS